MFHSPEKIHSPTSRAIFKHLLWRFLISFHGLSSYFVINSGIFRNNSQINFRKQPSKQKQCPTLLSALKMTQTTIQLFVIREIKKVFKYGLKWRVVSQANNREFSQLVNWINSRLLNMLLWRYFQMGGHSRYLFLGFETKPYRLTSGHEVSIVTYTKLIFTRIGAAVLGTLI